MNTETYRETEIASVNTELLCTDVEELSDVANAKPRTKYRIEERPDGFTISAKGRNTVRVNVSNCGFQLWTQDLGMDDEGSESGWLNLYALRKLVDEVCYGVMKSWGHSKMRRDFWSVKNTKQALANRIKEQSLRLRKTLDDRVVAMHKAVFIAAWGGAPCSTAVTADALRSHFPNDVVRYRAAAIAAANLPTLAPQFLRGKIDNLPELKFVREQCLGAGYKLSISPTSHDAEANISAEDLNSWQAFFSWNGRQYPALNRTLTNLPGGCPAGIVCHLKDIRLIRPITTRLQLITVCQAARSTTYRLEPVKNLELIQNADSEQIKRAIQLVSSSTGNTFSHRRTRDVGKVIFYLLDYPDQHNGNIVGLARRSIRWHLEMIQQRTIEIADELGRDRKCYSPRCPLPTQPEITFLDTVGAVCNEGIEMEHCVATHAKEAVYGFCLLFHVEHAGEAATVQVNPNGEVAQSVGSRNKSNEAAKWGAAKLTAWGKNMPPPTGIRPAAPFDDEDVPF